MQKQTKPQKQLNMDCIVLCQRNHAEYKQGLDLYNRNRKANAYSKSVAKRRYNRRESIKCLCLAAVLIVLILFALINGNANASSNTLSDTLNGKDYTMQGSLQGNYVVLENGNVHEVDHSYANYASEAKMVYVVLNDNGTEDVSDDIVLDIR